MLKAIETEYKDTLFRSRIEARWAVFFDTLGIKWEYEKEGYDLDGLWYTRQGQKLSFCGKIEGRDEKGEEKNR